eukprot:TRINITY_DN66072_c6_g6_i1.p1 TRINITY_DN66072_c6_g6~~TRINITY_DN66072_c6_g6_i1.p1  ORF type:complete len:895 (+),score=502.91 TRINITY_DN66072_c6_g6_i1:67-2751(+)
MSDDDAKVELVEAEAEEEEEYHSDDDEEVLEEKHAVYNRDSNATMLSKMGRPWEYCIQMHGFDKEEAVPSQARIDAESLSMELGDEFDYRFVHLRARGRVDKESSFIKVAASKEDLESWAEEFQYRVRVKPWKGGGYALYTRVNHLAGMYRHPGCNHQRAADCDCCRDQDSAGHCLCEVLLPYQRQALVRRKIDRVFNTWWPKRMEQYAERHPRQAARIQKKMARAFRKKGGLLASIQHKVVKQVYPLHTLSSPSDRNQYLSRRQVLSRYCSWFRSALCVLNIGKGSGEYLRWVRDYMGEKIALYFAFLHFYTTWLVVLAVFGTMLWLSQISRSSADNAAVPLYCLLVSLWSVTFLEFWQRRNAQLAHEWDMLSFEEEEEEMAEFAAADAKLWMGFYEPHGAWVDLTDWREQAMKDHGEGIDQFIPRQHRDMSGPIPRCCMVCVEEEQRAEATGRLWRFIKTLFTSSVVFAMIAVTVVITTSLLVLRLVMQEGVLGETGGGLLAGVLNGITIAALDFAFSYIAVLLNDLENHRTSTEYEDNLIAKEFFFMFVNNYFSLFYIAFVKGGSFNEGEPQLFGHTDYCKNSAGEIVDTCMSELQSQLTAMILTRLIIGNVVEYLLPNARFSYAVRKHREEMRRELKRQNPTWSRATLDRELQQMRMSKKNVSPVEAQALRPPYYEGNENVSGTFYDYSELAIQFGYVTLFAPAFPLGPLVAVINNIVEHRQDAYKILLTSQKPDYKGAQDMGTWYVIFRILGVTAVITNCFIIGFTSSQLDEMSFLDNPSTATKLGIVIFAEHIVFLVQMAIRWIVPQAPATVRRDIAKQSQCATIVKNFVDHEKWLEKRAELVKRRQSLDQEGTKKHMANFYNDSNVFQAEYLDPETAQYEIDGDKGF